MWEGGEAVAAVLLLLALAVFVQLEAAQEQLRRTLMTAETDYRAQRAVTQARPATNAIFLVIFLAQLIGVRV